MLTAVVVALTLALGPHPLFAGVLALALVQPSWFLVAAGAWGAWSAFQQQRARARLPRLEADFLRGMAAELDAGASIRESLVRGAARVPALPLGTAIRFARAGRPAPEVASHLRSALPVNGNLASAAYQIVSETGTKAAGVFTALGVRAAERGELERERRTLTAQVRFSAWLVGGLPVAVTVLLYVAGRRPDPTGIAGVLSLIGAGLIGLGALTIWLLVRER